jgi:hypothetical protein
VMAGLVGVKRYRGLTQATHLTLWAWEAKGGKSAQLGRSYINS